MASGCDEIACIGRHVASALAADFDDTEGGGIAAAALVGAGSKADPPGNDGVAQSALGIVVGRRQVGIEVDPIGWTGIGAT